MNDTPLPLIVSAMSTFGRSVTVANCANASRIAAKIVAVGAPHFPAEGAELVLDRPEIADRRDRRVRLQLVVIDDRR